MLTPDPNPTLPKHLAGCLSLFHVAKARNALKLGRCGLVPRPPPALPRALQGLVPLKWDGSGGPTDWQSESNWHVGGLKLAFLCQIQPRCSHLVFADNCNQPPLFKHTIRRPTSTPRLAASQYNKLR
ncbi:hypothetical protein VTJ04DRAFT_5766 [Mycothermus thermophilus]|uniref:uncharacterized protein n=1 Tax=Humicola insolens TaxID=85995 RepID=UPI00374341BD